MFAVEPCHLERWYSLYGFRARYNLSSSAAQPIATRELLALAGPQAEAEYLSLDLNYGPQLGSLRLRQAIAARYASVPPAAIQVTTGAAEALFLVLSACLAPGARIVVQTPIYPSIPTLAQGLGAQVIDWPLAADDQVDLQQLERLLANHAAQAIVLNHPHSPTGALLSADQLAWIAALAQAHGALLIIDEVYRGIQFGGETTAAAADLGPHAVSIGDMAKPYGLGGLRVGWIASHNQALLERCAELRDYTSLCNSTPGEFLAALALEHHDQIVARQLSIARQNRALFSQALPQLAWIEAHLADGGFTIFPRIHASRSSAAICHELCERFDVLVLPGEVFARPGHLRLGFGVNSEQFAAGLERLLDFAASELRYQARTV